MKVVSIVGTRPEAVKMAPVLAELARCGEVDSRLLVTAQHREMLDQVLDIFGITPAYDLDLMRPDQTPTQVLAGAIQGLSAVLDEFAPDWVLVQGDTTTALAGALVTAYRKNCRLAHVEAGLRTYDFDNPFPEELNRVLIDHACDLLFAPTRRSQEALLREGLKPAAIHVTGNTVIDALQFMSGRLNAAGGETAIPQGKRLILVTTHRRESHGAPIRDTFNALRQLAERDDVHLIYPVHPNPNVSGPAWELLGDNPHISLVAPLDYLSFVRLMSQAYLILTDSGGVQEEAPSLGVPVLVLRATTERQEAIEAGVAKLVGTDTATIVREATALLDDPAERARMVGAVNPFGDGTAARRIVDILRHTA